MKVTNPDFEQYLMGKHMEQYVGTDDDSVNDFERWLECFDGDDYIKHANIYAIEYAMKSIKNLV